MNSLRRGLFALWFYGLTVICVLVYLPALAMPRRVLMNGVAVWSRMLTWGLRVIGGVRIEIRGLDRLPSGPMLMAAKHQSMFDIVPPWSFLDDACFVVKKELTQIPVFGLHCAKTGMIPVDRDAGAAAMRDLLVKARDRLADGRQLIIFPEGTRRQPGEPSDYKPGVAALYRDLGLDCTPVATNSGQFLTASGMPRRPGVVVFEILETIPAGLKRGEFMRELQGRIDTASRALLSAD